MNQVIIKDNKTGMNKINIDIFFFQKVGTNLGVAKINR